MKLVLDLARYFLIAGIITLLGISYALATTQQEATVYGDNSETGKIFVFNGNRFYYEIYGIGEPLLLIHGNGADINSFNKQIDEFAKHYQVIAMDNRGQGKSELGTDSLTYEQMAEDSNALLEYLKLSHVNILGWSDGGIIGLLLAIHHPDKVNMLAVLGANIEPEGVPIWASEGLARIRKQINLELTYSDNPKPLELKLQLLDLLENQPHIPLTHLNQIQSPTLVMAGDRDIISDEHTLSIFHAIKKSQLAIFPGATHIIPLEDPARFNQTVLNFFAQPFAMPDSKKLVLPD